MNVPAGETQPAMKQNVVERRMLVQPCSAKIKAQRAGNSGRSQIDDGALIVNFREPAVGGHQSNAQRQWKKQQAPDSVRVVSLRSEVVFTMGEGLPNL